jgi:uncharacterized protein YaaN involved in tellurite resistance
METQTLTPPEPVTLAPPAPVAPVEKEQATAMVPVSDEDRRRMEEQADQFVDAVFSAEAGGDGLQDLVGAVHAMGNADIEAVVNASSRFMDAPVRTLRDAGDEGSEIARGMTELRIKVDQLDPSKRGPLDGARKLLGFIPFGNKLQAYFMEYQSAQTHIRKIIDSLRNGKDTLLQDNVEIEQEKNRLWELMGRLENLAYLAKVLDERLETRLAGFETQNPEKARVVREEMQFYLRQKRTDLLTQLAVAIQGYQVMDMGRKINLDLIKGVDRAVNTTVYALSVAVKAAQMLANQKLVLEQIQELNQTTEAMIAGTARMLKQNAAAMAEQASSATISIDTLKTAFADIHEAIDTVSEYKLKALAGLKESADALEGEIGKAKAHTDRARAAVVAEFQESAQTKALLSA